MKLAVVTSQFPVPGEPTRGRPILQTVEALSRIASVEVFVPNARYPRWLAPRSYNYVATGSGSEDRNGVRVHHLDYPTLPTIGRLTNGRAVAGVLGEPLRRYSPDVILSYWLYPDVYGAATVSRRLGIPLVAGARGSDLRARDRMTLGLTRRALPQAKVLLTVSDDLRRIAVARFGVRNESIRVILNGCDTRLFHIGDRAAARQALGIPASARLVLYVGRLVVAKGLRELADAWESRAAADPDLHVAFVGDGILRDELQQRAQRSGFANRMLLPGAAAAETVAQWMRAADVFCLPSYTEGYPNVLVEALACGRPVLSTPVGGIVEIVDESNGVLVPPQNAQALAAGLDAILARDWDEARLSARFARSWNDVAVETLAACEVALQSGRSAS
jgi:glycosyltransferase involved in cell wall biosynthesis